VLLRHASLSSVALVGYSFGAIVALRAGHDDAAVACLAAIAPPLPMFDIDFLRDTDKPVLLALGDRDQYCPLPALERAATGIGPQAALLQLDGADHFLAGFETQIGDRVARFIDAGSA
jgi:alpha/beta superfamily hydrolase